MNFREIQENEERQRLSPYASFSTESKGRDVEEPQCDLRTVYQRDRDRILHSKSFRRLKHKTQVFLSPEADHYRTRLTHTLEVAQISRTIARALKLNEDLTEAIALGHDLGHTPFGHAGERALTACSGTEFNHNEQSVRVVEKLENNGKGLNLTWEVRNGILCHRLAMEPATLEGQVVRLSDKIAYVNHDMDDAIRGGVMSEADLPSGLVDILGNTTKMRLNTLVHDVIHNSVDKDVVSMSQDVDGALQELRKFLFAHLYTNPAVKGEEVKAEKIVKTLYGYYMENVDKLPVEHIEMMYQGESQSTVVCDYIAGMSDNYAVSTFTNLYIPTSWQG